MVQLNWVQLSHKSILRPQTAQPHAVKRHYKQTDTDSPIFTVVVNRYFF